MSTKTITTGLPDALAGDHVELSALGLRASVSGFLTDIQREADTGVTTVYVDLGHGVTPSFNVGPGCAWSVEKVTREVPACEPGTTGMATVRLMGPFSTVETADVANGPAILGESGTVTIWAPGRGFIHSQPADIVSFVPDETRPLPTREQVSEALETRFQEARLEGYGPFSYHATNAVMDLLGGESA